MAEGPRWAHCTSNLRALSYRFAVCSDDPELGHHLDAVLAGLREPGIVSPAEPPAEHRYSLTSSSVAAGRVDVRRDGVDIVWAVRSGDAVGAVVWDVNRCAAEASVQHLLFHAGALDASGTGILVPGASGSGKSTLVAGLAHAGLGYLTDELAALDLSSDELHPYAKPITIKRGSFDRVPVPPALRETHPRGGRWPAEEWQVPVGTGTWRSIGRSCTPRLVIVPCFDPGASTTVTHLSDTEAFLYLALNAVNLLPHGALGMAALGRLASRCTCVALTMSDLDAACALVLELIEEQVMRVESGVAAHAG